MTTAIDTAMDSAKEALGSAKHTAKDFADDAAAAVKGTAGDAAKTTRKVLDYLRGIELDDVLWLVGLRRKRGVLEMLALIGGGVVIGAGAAILLTPSSGPALRRQIMNLFQNLGTEAKNEVQEVKNQAMHMADQVKDKAGEIAGEAREKVGEAREKVGEAVHEAAEAVGGAGQTEEGGTDDRKGRRRNNQNMQVS
jgi:gas vesicle protein